MVQIVFDYDLETAAEELEIDKNITQYNFIIYYIKCT